MHKLKKQFQVYPNKNEVRQLNHRVCLVLSRLSDLNVQIEAIDMLAMPPVIAVMHCPGTAQIHNSHAGTSCRHGEITIKRESTLHGCRITWSEST